VPRFQHLAVVGVPELRSNPQLLPLHYTCIQRLCARMHVSERGVGGGDRACARERERARASERECACSHTGAHLLDPKPHLDFIAVITRAVEESFMMRENMHTYAASEPSQAP
jgi:hypothetical protein